MSLETDDHLIRAPPKASTSRVLQERNSPDVRANINRDLLSKEKVIFLTLRCGTFSIWGNVISCLYIT